MCRSHFCGQAYCTADCRGEGYRAVQDQARAEHQASEEGRLDQRDRMRDHRALQNKPVTDDTSKGLPACGKVPSDFVPPTSIPDVLAPAVLEQTDVAAVDQVENARGAPVRAELPEKVGNKRAPGVVRCTVCGVILPVRRWQVGLRPG